MYVSGAMHVSQLNNRYSLHSYQIHATIHTLQPS